MSSVSVSGKEKPRELRRRVMLRARLRAGSGWSDTCILNVSSRGLMIHAAGQASKGSTIELWHGEHRIIATVVWRKGSQAGLRAQERVPVEDILSLGSGPKLQLTAGHWPQVDRRKAPRTGDDARVRGRAIEFAGIGIIAASLAIGVTGIVEEALAKFQGRGIGAALMQEAVSSARQAGARRLLLGVYAENTRAQAFYRKVGFSELTSRRFRVGSKEYDDTVFALPLS